VYIQTPSEQTETFLECELNRMYADADHQKQYHNTKWQFNLKERKYNKTQDKEERRNQKTLNTDKVLSKINRNTKE